MSPLMQHSVPNTACNPLSPLMFSSVLLLPLILFFILLSPNVQLYTSLLFKISLNLPLSVTLFISPFPPTFQYSIHPARHHALTKP
ncbi:hypothetical protein XENTR_v10016060 [Xenopus tropicalis]|nr:hypothetical protein XENTR_v10016060 [Xenopus tropicalis]